ncbi:nicotinate phosphoribosyltransferase [Leptolyngbya ohadii]|uniref:nicotinate phosphoribosyltransferase n=1 Tax=Leptolyngbya ohadii TaxID=1962290 RepID=UPI000B59F8E1|nr:nicotinate phosphoribosyltransferase [Leptolyngbya ohadii]
MPDTALSLTSQDYSLLTDLYQLTMAACYVGEGIAEKRASFELFTRRLPEGFGYMVAMGLAQAIDYLEQFSFTSEQIAALQATGIFANVPDRFWEVLASGRFTGDVWAVPEGTVVFANEPILRIEAPLWQAQIVETCLLNILNYQSLIATKAARMRDIAGSATLLEFGTRRAFGPQASLFAARAALAAGFDATSNVLAAIQLGQKPSGTMAHALVMALAALEGTEDEAFQAFHRYFPGATLLIDTYDAIAAAERLADRAQQEKLSLRAVRLDSGDLVSQSQHIRQLLPNTPIVASGDLDEFEIDRLQTAGAQIDSYGIGTKLVTGKPINGVYKLVEIDGIPVMKASEGKATYPGRKQIFRHLEAGELKGDRLGLITESPSRHEQPLLQPILKQGQRSAPADSLETIADRALTSLHTLPDRIRRIHDPESVSPEISVELERLTEAVKRQGSREQGAGERGG